MPLPPDDLAALSGAELRSRLCAGSGLPGPRANLTLLDRCAAEVDLLTLISLSDDDDEYLAMCGTAGIGRAIAATEVGSDALSALLDLLTEGARDERWRVREAVTRGLQLAADVVQREQGPLTVALSSPTSPVAAVITTWTATEDLRLLRAALATVCEPRLLHAPEAAAVALGVCDRATTLLDAAHAQTRRTDPWRSLRTTLEYAWSVAVAADPALGLPVFRRLEDDPSPVVQALVRKNLTRSRLAKLLG